jgi:beta-lactamase regulating signal transducer with metallopeptidase domain
MWEPPVPGKYTVIATFKGSGAYYTSYAETAFGVSETTSVAQEMEAGSSELTEATQAIESPFITIETAILAVVAVACIIGVVSFLALRKRK